MYVQLLGVGGKTTSVENCHPNVTGFLHSGRLCTCCAVRSAEVTASGRAILLASIPSQSHFSASALGRESAKTSRIRFSSMRPSSKASYNDDHFRSNHGDCESSGNDLADVSVRRASMVLNKAPFAFTKQSYSS